MRLVWSLFVLVFRVSWRRLTPALAPAWLSVLWFAANFGPILDWAALSRRIAALPAAVQVGAGAAWVLAWARLPRAALSEVLEVDLAWLQRQPMGRRLRGAVFGAVLVDVALLPGAVGALWPGGLWTAAGFVAGGMIAAVAFARGRPGVAAAAALVGAIGAGPLLAPLTPFALAALLEAPARPGRSTSRRATWTPPGPVRALLWRELLTVRRSGVGLWLLAVGVALPVGVLFRGFRRHATFGEVELGRGAAMGLALAGLVGGALVSRLVVRLGWPPVPRAWPVAARWRLVPLAGVVAASIAPTSLAFASAGVPATWTGAAPFALTAVATVVAVPAAGLLGRGATLGPLLGWTVLVIVANAVATPGGDVLLVLAALGLTLAAVRRAERG